MSNLQQQDVTSLRANNWTPIGRPADVKPHGTDSAGS
jgi:hypothetical protein